ncbi:MAG: Holliday junction branch migration protein RuvA [Endozoicomonas sp. (ex Botrylloides leachii)]|nr:Holliday junction branch migration protein RuvA [Endozoicomonas sp. (ex Botrylloides leachii)]
MISRITGLLVEKYAPVLVVEAGGIGYEIEAPMPVFYKLPDIGDKITLYTHFIVREDAQLLYGFSDKGERDLFKTLIKVNGVGPKLGLTILSGIESNAFVRCIDENDTGQLVKLPGVGKKTAERLIVEMKGKLTHWQSAPLFDGKHLDAAVVSRQAVAEIEEEAISALVALGYKSQQATQVVKTIYCESMTSEELIRDSLKSMIT